MKRGRPSLCLGCALRRLPRLAEAACATRRGLTCAGPAGRESFAVEVADDAAERAQGLMFRESLTRRRACCSSTKARARRRSG